MNTGHGAKSPQVRATLPFSAEVYRTPEAREASEIEALRIELRNEVRALRTLMARPAQPAAPHHEVTSELAAIRAALDELAPSTPKRDRTSAWLRAQGIEGPAATRIAALVKSSVAPDPDARLRAALGEVVQLAPWSDSFEGRRIVVMVGPSGVGKTTTVAKLAARARMQGRSVSLVSCDGFRVGAIDQLERYAGLIGASFHVARTSAELGAVLDAETADIVFVDSSGRPPTASTPEAALESRRKKGTVPVEVILCMAAATRAADAARVVATYAPVSPTSVCITKIDETASPSGIIHGPWAAKRPLSVLCHGPRVPEDVAPATFEEVQHRLASTPSAERST